MSDPRRRSFLSISTQSTPNLHYQPQHPRPRAPFDQYSGRESPSGSPSLDRMNNQTRHPFPSVERPRSTLSTLDRRDVQSDTQSAASASTRKSRFSLGARSLVGTPTATTYLHPESAASTPYLPKFKTTRNRSLSTQSLRSPLPHDIWEEAGSDVATPNSKKSSRSLMDRIKRRPKEDRSSIFGQAKPKPLTRATSVNTPSQHRPKSSVELKNEWAARRAKSTSVNTTVTTPLQPVPSPLGLEAEFEFIELQNDQASPREILERARARVSLEIPSSASVYSPLLESDEWLSPAMRANASYTVSPSPLSAESLPHTPVNGSTMRGHFSSHPDVPEVYRSPAVLTPQTPVKTQQHLSLSPATEIISINPTPSICLPEPIELSPEPPNDDLETTSVADLPSSSKAILPVSTQSGIKLKPKPLHSKKKTNKERRSFRSAYLTILLLSLLGANISFVVEHLGSGVGYVFLRKMGVSVLEAMALCLLVYLFGDRAIRMLERRQLGNTKKLLRGH